MTGSTRWRPERRRRIALTVCLALLLAAGLGVLLQSGPRRAGTNLALASGYSIALAPGQELCQLQELLPADTARVRLLARTNGPTGALAVRVLGTAGYQVAAGRRAAGWRPGPVDIPVGRLRATKPGSVCVRNEGAAAVAFGGSQPDPPYTIDRDGSRTSGRMRIEYIRPGSESWLEMLGVLSYRFSIGRSSLTRWWAAAAVLALMLGALALTARIVLRAGEGQR